MGRRDASATGPPVDRYRREIGRHDKRNADRINREERRRRENEAAVDSTLQKWPILILGVVSVLCGLLYLTLFFWLTVSEDDEAKSSSSSSSQSFFENPAGSSQ